jgi:hypothetical protein
VFEFILFPIFGFACKSSNREVGCNYKARGVRTNVRELNFELRIDRKKVPCRGTPISLVLLADSQGSVLQFVE